VLRIQRSRSSRPTAAGSSLVAVPDSLADLSELQSGVLLRSQLLTAGFTRDHVRVAVRSGKWQAFGRRVVVLHNAELTARQREWVAVLLPDKPAALAGICSASITERGCRTGCAFTSHAGFASPT
jgi:hypothetical protein